MNIQTDASKITQAELDHIHRMTKIDRVGRINAQARAAKMRKQARILREVCEDARKELEAQATYFGPHLDPENNLFRILRKLESVIEATEEA